MLELVVVIIIIAILASLGFTQYNRIVEKARLSEVIVNFGKMRTLIIAYYLEKGTLSTITNNDVGIGSDFPAGCVSTNYYWYNIDNPTDTEVTMAGIRCSLPGYSGYGGGGKPPDAVPYISTMRLNVATGSQSCLCTDVPSGNNVAWCSPCASP